jgi:uncharacterized protein YuzE
MRVTYDERANAVYVYLVKEIRPGGVRETVRATADVNVDIGSDGQVLGIEVLNAREIVPELVTEALDGQQAKAQAQKLQG